MIRNIKPRPWFRILRDLMAAGVSMARVATLCGKTGGSSTVLHWANGGEPKDSDARIVLALYRQHCPQQFEAHMQEYEPAVLVYVKPDHAIRGRPRPRKVGVLPPAGQFDFFVKEAA